MMPGTISGESTSACTSRLPVKLPRDRPIAAGVPSSTDSVVTGSATCRLMSAAPVHSLLAKKAPYHRVLKPGGGKLR